ncbi:MAG: TolC family protein [Candidatus Poribacteria bacterium]|nr:TolC family protein [Candidatus Poribacteria bacterium]MDE0503367.1 TolC family protein [Candidatus Poribacteria bacterium]
MIRRRSWFALAFALMFFAQHADADDSDVGVDLSKPLTLDKCIELALEESSDMRNARLDFAIQDLRVKNVRAQFLPQVLLGSQYRISDRVEFGFKRANYDVDVTGRYTLWDHGQRRANYLQAKERRNSTENRNERIKQGLIFQIIEAYYDVLKTRELVKVSKEILARSQENTAATKVHVQVGNLIPADIATSQVREANDELSLLSNENALKIAEATLPRLMGLKPGTEVILAKDSDFAAYLDSGEIEVTDMAVEEAIELSNENRPEFKELSSLLAQLEADRKLAKLARLPQLDADLSYAVNLDDYLHERENFNEFRSWDFTTRLNFPIFDGGVIKRRIQEVDLSLNQTREDAKDLERSIALEVRQAYLNLKRAERALDISGTQVRNAESSLEVIRGRFQQELAFLLELLDAQTEYAQALTNQVRSFYDYKIARSALQRAMGTLN